MGELLQRLERWLSANRPAYLASLQPGLSEAQLANLEKKLGGRLPSGLAELLRWRDGQRSLQDPGDSDFAGFVDNSRLLCAKDIASTAEMLDGHLKAGEWEDKVDWWHKGWIPFLDNGSSDLLCVDLVGAFGGRPGQILEFWHDDPGRTIVAPDFASWLSAFVASLEAGLWEEHGGSLRPKDDAALKAFQREHLSGYPIEASAKRNDKKKQARLSAREAIEASLDPLTGPRGELARPVELDKVLKAARIQVQHAMDDLMKRGEGSKVEGIYEILPAPGEKRIAYAVWGSRVLANFRDGMVIGLDLKGGSIFKKKAVA